MSATKPRSIIFVPGSFHSTEYYHIIISKLRELQYPGRIITCELPSNHASQLEPGSPVANGMTADIETIEALIKIEVIDHQNPVLLVAHSYGSVPASCAIEKFANLNMVRFLNVCGLMIKKGESVYSYCPQPGCPPPIHKVKGEYIFPDENVVTLYNGVPEDEKQRAIDGLLWQHMSASLAPTTFEGWAAVLTTYLVGTEDQAIPPIAQESFVANTKERGVNVELISLPTGHSPMLSMPDELLDVIMRASR